MQWFKNLNAMPRLVIAFGIIIAMLMGMSYLAISRLSQANASMATLYQDDMLGAIHTDNMQIARFTLGRAIRDAVINAADGQIVSEDEKVVQAQFEKMRSELDAADKTFYTKEGLAAVAAIRNSLPAYERADLAVFDRLRAKDIDGAKAAIVEANETGKSVVEASNKAKEVKEQGAETKYQTNTQNYQSARTMMLAITAAALVLGGLMAILIARSFSVPLGLAVQAMQRVADGDLTAAIEIDSKDEVGRMARALNDALDNLRNTMEQVSEGALASTSSSQQLASASGAIATGAQEQSASLEETSASLEEITATVRQSADNARQASQLASSSKEAAEQGQGVVSNAVTAMSEINAASSKISDIISTIDEIAFQTNLLAVNAAVEAARAGEEGRGFAVVAAEVRSLAQRSAGAAKEIKALIQDSQRKVERGTELVNKSGETLQGIVSSVKRVTDIVAEMAAAAAEQSTGIQQVNTAMTQMDQVTQSNSAQTEELSSTAEALAEQSGRLMELVKTFKLTKSGKTGRLPAPARTYSLAATAPLSMSKPRMARANKPEVRSAASTPARTPALAAAPAAGGAGDEANFEEF
jgi:methyl-accepting chemotaxis protein